MEMVEGQWVRLPFGRHCGVSAAVLVSGLASGFVGMVAGSHEARCQESPKQESPKQESPKQESPKQESPKQESPKQTPSKQASPKQEPSQVRARLVYERALGAEECPDHGAALATFVARLGAEAIEPAASSRVRVTVRATSEHEVAGHIELVDGDGRRLWANDLRARRDDCDALIESMAVSLRDSVDGRDPPPAKPDPLSSSALAPAPSDPSRLPERHEQPIILRGTSSTSSGATLRLPPGVALAPPAGPLPGKSGQGTQSPRLPGASDADSSGANESESEPGTGPSYRIWAGSAVVIGAAPVPTGRISFNFALTWPLGSFSVEARGIVPATAHIGAYDISLARWEGAFLPCLARGIFFACAAVSAGGIWIEASSSRSEVHSLLHVSAGVRAGIELAVTSTLGLLAFIDGDASVLPTTLRAGGSALWAEPPVQVALGIAISGTFPAALREGPQKLH